MVPWEQIEKICNFEPVDREDIRIFSYSYRSILSFLGFNTTFHTKSVLEVGRTKIRVINEKRQIEAAKALYRFIIAFRNLSPKDQKIWEARHLEHLDHGDIWQLYIRGPHTPLTERTIKNGADTVGERLRLIYSRLANFLTSPGYCAKIRYDP